ncbi:MAG TPA: hypothetical protein VEV44_10260 [Pseudoneobacillus sp.]|nr:hypothetical protein [Pseudoneobacillus sp.]
MKKYLMGVIALILLLSFSLIGCSSKGSSSSPISNEGQQKGEQQTPESAEKVVTELVMEFCQTLQKVSLSASQEIVNKSIQENYKDFVSPTLLSKWMKDTQNAPGRLTSSPWPDRIELVSIEKLSNDAYKVKGEIMEVTSTEKADGGFAAKRPITLVVKKNNQLWLIDDVTIGAYEEIDNIVYQNSQYGFNFSLPVSWQDYKIVTEKWEGLANSGSQGEKVVETGPMILIRHPEWTSQNQRQDIPVMVFTHSQWDTLQTEEFHIGAAPIGPSELGRNSKYVFALPARYNFAFPTGYEEVETILNNQALQPTESVE